MYVPASLVDSYEVLGGLKSLLIQKLYRGVMYRWNCRWRIRCYENINRIMEDFQVNIQVSRSSCDMVAKWRTNWWRWGIAVESRSNLYSASPACIYTDAKNGGVGWTNKMLSQTSPFIFVVVQEKTCNCIPQSIPEVSLAKSELSAKGYATTTATT